MLDSHEEIYKSHDYCNIVISEDNANILNIIMERSLYDYLLPCIQIRDRHMKIKIIVKKALKSFLQ